VLLVTAGSVSEQQGKKIQRELMFAWKVVIKMDVGM